MDYGSVADARAASQPAIRGLRCMVVKTPTSFCVFPGNGAVTRAVDLALFLVLLNAVIVSL